MAVDAKHQGLYLTVMPRRADTEIPRLLLDWYRTNKRDLPWRRTKDPYRIWVAEVMLQQTRVDTVIPYYERFLKKFPDVRALARAREDSVLKAWESLGYYSRARHLHEAARVVVGQSGGVIPAGMADLRKLPGVGAYTAGAILSIAFGRRVAAVDGNVIRVIARLFAIEDPVDGSKAKRSIEAIAQGLVPAGEPGHYNQALMDLGSGICTPRRPACPACPLAAACRARRKGLQEAIPAKRKAASVPHREAAVAVIRNDRGEILLVKRPGRGLLGGLWRFPGGALEEGDAPAAALRRSLRTELGLKAIPGRELAAVEHGYSHFTVTVRVFACALRGAIPDSGGGVQWRWVGMKGLSRLAVSRLERKILKAMRPIQPVARPFDDGKTALKHVK
jgi:A/G-specific adenine glycosylase